MVEEDRLDIREFDERLDLDSPRLPRLHRAELVVGDHHLLTVEVVAVRDLLPGHLLVLFGAEAPLLDARVVLLMQLVEVEVEVACGRDELDRDVHEPEAERAAPQRSRHRHRLPRLASSAAIRSSPCAGSSCSARSISSPFPFRLIRSSTASR